MGEWGGKINYNFKAIKALGRQFFIHFFLCLTFAHKSTEFSIERQFEKIDESQQNLNRLLEMTAHFDLIFGLIKCKSVKLTVLIQDRDQKNGNARGLRQGLYSWGWLLSASPWPPTLTEFPGVGAFLGDIKRGCLTFLPTRVSQAKNGSDLL